MKHSHITLARTLTYAGALPFMAAVLVAALPALQVLGLPATTIAATYGAVIASFLCGIHWAVQLFFAERCPCNLLLSSNIIALAAWLSLLVTLPWAALALQILCFLLLVGLDRKLRDAGILPAWFYRLRCRATFIVVLCLLAVMVFSWGGGSGLS